MVLTWCSCKHDGEQVDANGDGVEDRKSSEAVGHRVSLRIAGRECRNYKQFQQRDISPSKLHRLFHVMNC